jgi:aspartyl-tRNA(Asn)/glutamyl-tRNA(Gln) amidotransferase subunit B
VTVSPELLEEIRGTLIETPPARRRRFQDQHQLSYYDASVLVAQGPALADYFEQVAEGCGDGKQAANWVTQDVLREMNQRHLSIAEFPIRSEVLAALLRKVGAGEITTKSAREIFADLLADADADRAPTVERIDQIIREKDLAVVSDTGQLEGVIDAVIARNPKAVEDFQGGKQQAVGKLIGEVMREVKGADAKVVRQMLVERLGS